MHNHEEKQMKQYSHKPNNKKPQIKWENMTKEKLTWKNVNDRTEGSLISLGMLELQDQMCKWALEVLIK